MKGDLHFNAKDITGQRFGRLTAMSIHHTDNVLCWLCKCDCGKEIVCMGSKLRNGNTRSCGCLKHEELVARSTKHGLSRHGLYQIWRGIMVRCYDKKSPSYKDYGANGTRMHEEWLNDFTKFYDWCMKHDWKKGLHICRNGDVGNYSPDNCYIATGKQNSRDRKSNVLNMWKARVIRVMKNNHGWSNKKQAEFWGVSQSVISCVLRNKIWA